jgi:formate dehydrogenase major subunit
VDSDVLEMHPADANKSGYRNGEMVRLVSARAQACLPVTISERVQPGQLFTSFHFPHSDVNRLLSSSADESSKCPEYKVSVVRLEPLTASCSSPRSTERALHARLIH